MDFHLEGQLEFRAYAVNTRNQDWVEILGLIHREQSAEAADFTEHAFCERLMGEILDALLGAVGLVDVDARVGVRNGFGGILGHGASVYDVWEPDSQEKNLQIVARSRRRKTAFTADCGDEGEDDPGSLSLRTSRTLAILAVKGFKDFDRKDR